MWQVQEAVKKAEQETKRRQDKVSTHPMYLQIVLSLFSFGNGQELVAIQNVLVNAVYAYGLGK